MLKFQLLASNLTQEHLGLIPSFLYETDTDKAALQLNKNYQHGGGWRPMPGWEFDPVSNVLYYHDDPPLPAIAMVKLREETIFIFPHSWVLIMQPDLSFEVSRMD